MLSQKRWVPAVILLAAASVAVPSARAQYVQQGGKLIGSGAVSNGSSASCDLGSYQGASAALSSDGNTAVVGGDGDDSGNGAVWIFTRTGAAWSQQGGKLVGSGATNLQNFEGFSGSFGVCQGGSVAISNDGNTVISGGSQDNGSAGAAWVFTHSGGAWSQQGPRLGVLDAPIPEVDLGSSVALSADGNTALLGGFGDYNADETVHSGAIWPFTRSLGTWSQQGDKLVASGLVNPQELLNQGWAVALSGDGNTAIEAGWGDCLSMTSCPGAVGVFTRTNGQWSQQGIKLGVASTSTFGWSVSLSADGNTALMGAYQDNGDTGAAFVFVRSGGTWTMQAKLVGSGYVGTPWQGYSVSLSADGNMALVGGPYDNVGAGAAWVFKRSNGAWSQLGSKLVGSSATGAALQGWSVALSGDGNTILVGGPEDNNNVGATWVFVPGASSGAAPVGVSPASGSASSQSMAFTFTDPRGTQDFDVVNVLINNFLDGRNACYLAYSRSAGVLYLVANDG
ncbi:MAG TPA: hypothetical protein VE959_34845, partial [Bryobacteraceae bacterium]|nr:hypothetical protein [Bryobacteraceae bacterium]